MDDMWEAFALALGMILRADEDLLEIIGLSMRVSLAAVAVAAAVGLPLGGLLAMARFPGRRAMIVALNALMGLPPVVVGLFVYLLLSASGPLGPLRLLYTPTAMVIAQALLVTPIVMALSRAALSALEREYRDWFASLGLGPGRRMLALIVEGRRALLTALMAGFGRAIAEVGAVLIVGGNIHHVTRVMTTAIALETSRGELAMALALGLVLMALALGVNAAVALIGGEEEAHG